MRTRLRRELSLLLCALQFLTRVPIGGIAFAPDSIARSARYFPLIGQMVGALCSAVLYLSARLWPQPIPVVLALAAGVVLTGAFHEDGLADTADGLGGGHDRAQRLAIMKDSRIGTYGVLALILCLAVKASALMNLSAAVGAVALVAIHGLARAAAVVAMASLPYAGDVAVAKVKPVPGGVSGGEALLAVGFGLWPLAVFDVPNLPAILGLGMIFALFTALQARRLIGGYTGDVLGAVEQMFETGALLALALK